MSKKKSPAAKKASAPSSAKPDWTNRTPWAGKPATKPAAPAQPTK